MSSWLVVLLLAIGGRASAAATPPRCAGRYLLSGDVSLSYGPGTAHVLDAVELSPKSVTLPGICKRARTKAVYRSGRWQVKVSWPRCAPMRNVRFRGEISGACDTLSGALRVGKPKQTYPVTAARSRCGDGILDLGGKESCDPPGTFRCDVNCDLAPPTCSNGTVDLGEECDDANLDDTDGCTRACKTAPRCTDQDYASTWDALQALIFERHGCASAVCHGNPNAPTGEFDLRPEHAYASLVGTASTRDPNLQRVAVGDPRRSLLYLKVAPGLDVGRYGSPMPLNQAALSDDEIDALQLWIHAGAPATGVVPNTASKLRSCLATPTPPKIEPLPPPAAGTGVQLYAPPWKLPPRGEDEVCFATYYDISAQVPAERRLPCPDSWGGTGKTCMAYTQSEFRQDPNSHHSLIYAYTGSSAHTAFGAFTCHGGPSEGTACDPTKPGVAAPVGADCGARAACAGEVSHLSPACLPAIGGAYGPGDFSTGGGLPDTATTHGIGGSQTPVQSVELPASVYAVLPLQGVIVWNSHAFNLTDTATTNEQWLNLEFGSSDHQHLLEQVFVADAIFATSVPPFREEELCNTATFGVGTRLMSLSSHTHKRGKRFRVWGPGVAPCNGASATNCKPETSPPLFTTTDYSSPASVTFTQALPLDDPAPNARTFKYCAVYDNGFRDPSTVKRRSSSPLLSLAFCNGYVHTDLSCCSDLVCVGANAGKACQSLADCESAPGAGDSACDACALYGGVTTEDEMFILTGTQYHVP